MRKLLSLMIAIAFCGYVHAQQEIQFNFQCMDYKQKKECPKAVTYYFNKDNVIDKIEIMPCFSAKNINNGTLLIEDQDIMVFKEYHKDLKQLLNKFKEYIQVAKDNHITDYKKVLDSMIVNNPAYSGSFIIDNVVPEEVYMMNSRFTLWHRFVVSNGVPSLEFLRTDIKGTKVKTTSDHDFFYTTTSVCPMVYITFTTPEQLESYIKACDISEARRMIKDPHYKYKDKDDLFK